MSKITKRKYVEQEVMEFVLPTGNQQIVKVTGGRGNNLHAVVDAKGETFLVSMPNKFRKNIWIKRGDFIIIDPIEEGDKVRGEIAHVLFKDHVCHIQKEGLWPEAFGGELPKSSNYVEDDLLPPSDSEDEDDLAFRVVNVNKGSQLYEHSSDEEEEEEEEGGDEEEGEKGKREEKRTMLLQPQKKLVEADRLFLLRDENVLLVRTESCHCFSALEGSSLFKTLLAFSPPSPAPARTPSPPTLPTGGRRAFCFEMPN